MDVNELSRKQLEELKCYYFYKEMEMNGWSKYQSPSAIPDKVVFDHYAGISFTDDDFLL